MNDSNARPLRLTLVISSLGAGGAERVMTILANHWAAQEWQLTLLTLDDGSHPPFYPLHPSIRHIPLDLYCESSNWGQKIYRNCRRLLILRRAIKLSQAEAVLSFLDRTNILVLASTRMLHVPVLVSEHIHPTASPVDLIRERLRSWLYPMSSAVVTLTQQTADVFPKSWQHMITVIPNPVLPPPQADFVDMQLKRGHEGLTIVGMGRLVPQKGFDLLIEAFSQIADGLREWRLVILGEGPLRRELEDLAIHSGFASRIYFTGIVSRPDIYLRQADLFVLPSRFEGFPMALCEAMACGLPVVSADCLTGPREIVRPGIDGLLVEPENSMALAQAMASLMSDEVRRHEMGTQAREVISRFGLDKVSSQWTDLFRKVSRIND